MFLLLVGCINNGLARTEERVSPDLGGAFDFDGLLVLPADDGELLDDDIDDFPYSSDGGSVDEGEAGGGTGVATSPVVELPYSSRRPPLQQPSSPLTPSSGSPAALSVQGDGNTSAITSGVDAAGIDAHVAEGPLEASEGRIEVLGFAQAKAAVASALTDPNWGVPYKVRWPGQAVLALVSEPADPLLKRFWASLMQMVSYGLQCTTEFRELRAMDKREKPPSQERLQQLRNRATRCMRKMRVFLEQQQQDLIPLFDKQPESRGFAYAKELLQALLEIGGCLERRAEVTTAYFSVFRYPEEAETAGKLRAEREALLKEYAKLKRRLASAAQQCEARRLLPRVCSVLKLM